MTQNRTRNITGKLCGLLIFAILLVGIPTLIYDIYYDLNDDVLIKDIVNLRISLLSILVMSTQLLKKIVMLRCQYLSMII